VLAVLLPGLATLIGGLLRQDLVLSTDVIDFFLATVVVALVGGLGPALVRVGVQWLAAQLLLRAPVYSLTIAEPENLVTVVIMVLVAVWCRWWSTGPHAAPNKAARASTEAALLASYARTVLMHDRPLERLLEKVKENFGLTSVALLEKSAANGPGSPAPATVRATTPMKPMWTFP